MRSFAKVCRTFRDLGASTGRRPLPGVRTAVGAAPRRIGAQRAVETLYWARQDARASGRLPSRRSNARSRPRRACATSGPAMPTAHQPTGPRSGGEPGLWSRACPRPLTASRSARDDQAQGPHHRALAHRQRPGPGGGRRWRAAGQHRPGPGRPDCSPSGRPGPPRSVERPRAAARSQRPASAASMPGRQDRQPVRPQLGVPGVLGAATRPSRPATLGTSAPAGPGPGQLEEPVLDPAVGADAAGPARRCSPAGRPARRPQPRPPSAGRRRVAPAGR